MANKYTNYTMNLLPKGLQVENDGLIANFTHSEIKTMTVYKFYEGGNWGLFEPIFNSLESAVKAAYAVQMKKYPDPAKASKGTIIEDRFPIYKLTIAKKGKRNDWYIKNSTMMGILYDNHATEYMRNQPYRWVYESRYKTKGDFIVSRGVITNKRIVR